MKKLIVFLNLLIVSSTNYSMNITLNRAINRATNRISFGIKNWNKMLFKYSLRSYHKSNNDDFREYLDLLKKKKEVIENLNKNNDINNQEKNLEKFYKLQNDQSLENRLCHLENMLICQKIIQSNAYNRLLQSSCLMEYVFQLDIDENRKTILFRLGASTHMHARKEYDETSLCIKENQEEIACIKAKLGWSDKDIIDKEE